MLTEKVKCVCVCESSIYFLCVSTSCRHAFTRQTIDRKWWIFTALEPPGEIFVNILSIHDFAPRINNQSFLHIFLLSFHFSFFCPHENMLYCLQTVEKMPPKTEIVWYHVFIHIFKIERKLLSNYFYVQIVRYLTALL